MRRQPSAVPSHAVERRADGGGKGGVLGDDVLHAVELCEELEGFVRGREHRERAGEHDRVRAAGAAGEHGHRADGLQDKIHKTAHLVGARGVLGELGEVRRRRLRRQRADLALGHIADGEVDLGEVAVLTELADERVLVHARDELAEARERTAADAAANDVAVPTIAEYGRRGVLALLADSTNAERPGFTATEQTVAEGVRRLFAKAGKRRIIVATFASNIYRVQQIIDLAIESGRKVAVSGRSMVSNTEMAKELGYLHAPDNVLITIDEINKYPPEKVVLITTGSQGEPLSALSRMAQASHRQVRVGPNDFIIISARPIPGNEKTVTKVVNGLLTLGAEVIYENMYDTHVSGHACQEEQKLMLTLAHPQFFLPVHGEFKQLKRHAETAEHLGYIPKQNIYIAENGQNIRISADGMTVENTVTAGAVMVDGYGVGDVGNVVLRDRHHLSEDGIIIVTAAIDGSNGQVLSGPDLVSRGFVYVRESEELMEGARTQVEMALDRSLADNMHDWASVKARVRESLSSYIYRRTKRSPMILPILLEV